MEWLIPYKVDNEAEHGRPRRADRSGVRSGGGPMGDNREAVAFQAATLAAFVRRLGRSLRDGSDAFARAMLDDPVRWSSHESIAGWTMPDPRAHAQGNVPTIADPRGR